MSEYCTQPYGGFGDFEGRCPLCPLPRRLRESLRACSQPGRELCVACKRAVKDAAEQRDKYDENRELREKKP